ncbi:MAG: endonuclease [Bacteroidota bacterium]
MTHRFFIIFSFILFQLTNSIIAQIPKGYYTGTESLGGEELKTALYNIIKGHTEFPYTSASTDVWDILKKTDQDTINSENVILLYSGWSVNAAQEWNNDNGWNREHVWAKSHGDFGTELGAGTDVHALRPCDISINTARWNYDFAIGGEIYVDPEGTTECRLTSNSWEPRDIVKGDVARMIFYMATRYEGENFEPDLEIVDYVDSSPGFQPLHGKLSDLYEWHKNDPVSDWERNRNDIIYDQYQGNRNPFIDHPEFAEKIWGHLVSTNTIDIDQEISVFPNPCHNQIQVELDNRKTRVKTTKVQIINIYGKLVKNILASSSVINITCSDLTTGVYILKIIYPDNSVYRKLLIKN